MAASAPAALHAVLMKLCIFLVYLHIGPSIAGPFIVLYGMAWHGIVLYLNLLYSIACYFIVSYGIALYCIVLDFIARY